MTEQMVKTHYESDDGRYPPPHVGEILCWGNPHAARLIVAVRWFGRIRGLEECRGNVYDHASGYDVDTTPCPPAKLLGYLRTGQNFHPDYPGWGKAVAECERMIAVEEAERRLAVFSPVRQV